MITLTRITDPIKLQEYFRFRYRIYNESRFKGFLAQADRLDKDAYDDRAYHFGWYVDGKLAGCIRFIEADATEAPLPMLAYLPCGPARTAVESYLADRKALGQRTIEASRFCLAPAYRGLRNAKEFVLAMVLTAQHLGFEHGLFDMRSEHAAFYRHLGFDDLGAEAISYIPLLERNMVFFHFDFATLITRNQELLGRIGATRSARMKKAA